MGKHWTIKMDVIYTAIIKPLFLPRIPFVDYPDYQFHFNLFVTGFDLDR